MKKFLNYLTLTTNFQKNLIYKKVSYNALNLCRNHHNAFVASKTKCWQIFSVMYHYFRMTDNEGVNVYIFLNKHWTKKWFSNDSICNGNFFFLVIVWSLHWFISKYFGWSVSTALQKFFNESIWACDHIVRVRTFYFACFI